MVQYLCTMTIQLKELAYKKDSEISESFFSEILTYGSTNTKDCLKDPVR